MFVGRARWPASTTKAADSRAGEWGFRPNRPLFLAGGTPSARCSPATVEGTVVDIGKIPDGADCGDQEGWHYDNPAAPTTVISCPDS